MTTGKNDSTPKLALVPRPLAATTSFALHEALHSLLAFAQVLGSLPPGEGKVGGTPTIILTAAGVEIRMSDAMLAGKSAAVINAVPPEWLHKIGERLESVRDATKALNLALGENVLNTGQTLAAHAAAIDSMRAALTENEQIMESIVELLGPGDNFNMPRTGGFATIA